MPYKDPQAQKDYHKKWRDANPDKVKANVKKWRSENPDKLRQINREYTAKWRAENPDRWEDIRRRTKYGMEPEEFQAMKEKQNEACAICLQRKKLSVDHDHQTGRVRGLLCTNCNTALGKLHDNSDNLRRAADYLERE